MNSGRSGFTLLELLLYISILTLFMGGIVQFGWNILIGRTKSAVIREVTQNLEFAMQRITYEIRNASAINSVSATSLCLASATVARNPTKIYLSSGRIHIGWGGGSSTCATLTNDKPLTSNRVTVSTFIFENLTSGTASKNVRYTIGVNYNVSSGRKEWMRTQIATGSSEIRSN